MGSGHIILLRFGLLVMLCAASFVLPLLQAGPAVAGEPAIVITPPWYDDHDALLARSAGAEIAPNRTAFAMLAVLEDPGQAALSGAWLVLDAGDIPIICNFLEGR